MANVIIDDTNLTNIGDAIREQNGLTTKYKPSEMAEAIRAIEGGGTGELYDYIPEDAFTLRGNCSYRFYNGNWYWFFEKYKDRIVTKDITSAMFMFYNNTSKITEIPFDINLSDSYLYDISLKNLFSECRLLEKIPYIKGKIGSTKEMISGCYRLKEIPEDWTDYIDFSTMHSQSADISMMFCYCYSLRKIPQSLLNNLYTGATTSTTQLYYRGFSYCYVLEELKDLPVPQKTFQSNMFYATFYDCHRLKDVTFAVQEDGTPYTVNWKTQTIDLSNQVGYAPSSYHSRITGYNSGLTEDTLVTLEQTPTDCYLARNNPDFWTDTVYYSRYDYYSAIATINSLPDTSAYLASAGGTNTIKFDGDCAGSVVDETGFIGVADMSEEEIAIATAKGWTVTFV